MDSDIQEQNHLTPKEITFFNNFDGLNPYHSDFTLTDNTNFENTTTTTRFGTSPLFEENTIDQPPDTAERHSPILKDLQDSSDSRVNTPETSQNNTSYFSATKDSLTNTYVNETNEEPSQHLYSLVSCEDHLLDYRDEDFGLINKENNRANTLEQDTLTHHSLNSGDHHNNRNFARISNPTHDLFSEQDYNTIPLSSSPSLPIIEDNKVSDMETSNFEQFQHTNGSQELHKSLKYDNNNIGMLPSQKHDSLLHNEYVTNGHGNSLPQESVKFTLCQEDPTHLDSHSDACKSKSNANDSNSRGSQNLSPVLKEKSSNSQELTDMIEKVNLNNEVQINGVAGDTLMTNGHSDYYHHQESQKENCQEINHKSICTGDNASPIKKQQHSNNDLKSPLTPHANANNLKQGSKSATPKLGGKRADYSHVKSKCGSLSFVKTCTVTSPALNETQNKEDKKTGNAKRTNTSLNLSSGKGTNEQYLMHKSVSQQPKTNGLSPYKKPDYLKNVQSKIGSLPIGIATPHLTNKVMSNSDENQPKPKKTNISTTANINSKISDLKNKVKSKIGSLENASYTPAGGKIKIQSYKLDFKDKAASKVQSKPVGNLKSPLMNTNDVQLVTANQ
ncbi:probable serine/threonine-protein kinase MARK-A isoform X2 [Gordionus sp. m RMFG-2023]|uniref:probable serine/threonine-protein kinase MARK-A isoform X2 n=1 Tax=Gordionus sp. m RMFG-2023 TaxID=3053472 RepID=UPI0031FC299B